MHFAAQDGSPLIMVYFCSQLVLFHGKRHQHRLCGPE